MTRRQRFLTAGLGVAALTIQTIGYFAWGAEQVQGNVAALTLIVSGWFMVLYSRDPWWRSWFGRSLMLIAVAITVACVATVAFRRLGDYPGRDAMLIASADLTFLAMLIRTLVLRNEQRADRRNDHLRPGLLDEEKDR